MTQLELLERLCAATEKQAENIALLIACLREEFDQLDTRLSIIDDTIERKLESLKDD